MRILLDECVDSRLTSEFEGHDVTTVPAHGWANTPDGKLLELAQQEFDVLVTVDRNLPFQQNVQKFDICVVILQAHSNRLVDLKPLVPPLLNMLPKADSGKVLRVPE